MLKTSPAESQLQAYRKMYRLRMRQNHVSEKVLMDAVSNKARHEVSWLPLHIVTGIIMNDIDGTRSTLSDDLGLVRECNVCSCAGVVHRLPLLASYSCGRLVPLLVSCSCGRLVPLLLDMSMSSSSSCFQMTFGGGCQSAGHGTLTWP